MPIRYRTSLLASALAAAFGATLSAPALAQSNVTIYGTTMLFTERVDRNDMGALTRMGSGTSNLGFRGSEDLGGGLKALFQFETGLILDQDGNPPVTNSSFFPTRNSHVALAGDWGTFSLGNWDTPYKVQILDIGPVRGLNPFDNPLMGNGGFAVPVTTTQSTRVGGGADAAFNRRQGNMAQYWTPKVGGFSGRVGYSLGEGRTTVNNTTIKPTLFSMGVRYDMDGLSLRYGYERHDDYFGLSQMGGSAPGAANASATDQAHFLAAVYTTGGTRVAVMWERLRYENDDTTPGAVKRRSRDAWEIFAQHRMGQHQVFAEYSKAGSGSCSAVGAACSSSGLGATAWMAGYGYALSRRTEVYGAYYAINNERNARYAVFPPAGPTLAGTDVKGLGVGIVHLF